MENWLNINQKRSHEWQLKYTEAILCAFYSQDHSWVRTRIPDEDGDYLCIRISKLIKELPLIGTTKLNFSKGLNNLVKKEIFNKIVDEDDKKTVFYRFNPIYKDYWKFPNLILASNIQSKILCIANVIELKQLLSNDNSIIKSKQLFLKYEEVLSNDNKVLSNDNKVLSNDNLSNKQSNKQSNKHNHMEQEDDFSSKNTSKENLLKTEFEKLCNIYPTTVNNSPRIIAKAFGSFSNLNQSQRVDLFKATKNYSKTQQVKDHQSKNTTNFIQNLNNFITKSYTQFIYGLPEGYIFAEDFNTEKNPSGGGLEDVTVFNGNGKVSISLKPFVDKFEAVKSILENDETFSIKDFDNYNDDEIKSIFNEKEYEIFSQRMGWVSNAHKLSVELLAETLNEYLEENE